LDSKVTVSLGLVVRQDGVDLVALERRLVTMQLSQPDPAIP
jgi:hypothetical protein